MKVSYNWLKELVDFDLSPDALAALLTMLGLEVEGMERLGDGMDDVVVARVEERLQHPNADKLSLCKVNNGKEILSIVCGAQNFKAGDTVALATIGAVLPGDFRIKRSKIRGEESFGMLCSEKELALAEESAGIMILPDGLPLGGSVFEALGLKDTILEVSLTPNRADCLSMIGIAREVAAKLGTTVKMPQFTLEESGDPIGTRTSVTIEDADLCPRYAARFIEGCSIAPSPAWLVKRLQALGMRSINNVVDVTNYVLMEYGHPLHAFDFRQLAGGRIVVRRAGEGELFTTLDGQERKLLTSDLTIRDGERAVALAGIMGGENSEIADDTTTILLESAWFNPSAIRLTSKRLGLHTESSHRFERGADIGAVPTALDRAASLIAQLAGGRVAKGAIDACPGDLTPRSLTIRQARVTEILGIELSLEQIADLLRRLQCGVEAAGEGALRITVPTWRGDIEREIDLVEEVARLHGYDAIPATMPTAQVVSDRPTRHQSLERALKDLLVAQGFNEVINFSFAAAGDADRILLANDDPRRTGLRLLNPLVEEHTHMRTTLLPALLQTASRNAGYRILDQQLFEVRRVYLPTDAEQPREPLMVAGIMTGLRSPEGWNQGKEPVDFYDLKGAVETILEQFRVPAVSYVTDRLEPFYHPGKACSIVSGRDVIGSCGELHPDVQESYELARPLYYFEIDFDQLVRKGRETLAVSAPSRYPDNTRDVALLLDDSVSGIDVVRRVEGLKNDKIEEVSIFDLYKGEHLEPGKKSLAIRVRYRAADRTLTDEEVNQLHQKVVAGLVSHFGAIIR